MTEPRAEPLAALLGVFVAGTIVVQAQDWPQWRGPNRDGAIAAFTEPASWPAALTRQWQADIGTGYATPLIVGDRIYSFSRQKEDEVLTAFEAASGKSPRPVAQADHRFSRDIEAAGGASFGSLDLWWNARAKRDDTPVICRASCDPLRREGLADIRREPQTGRRLPGRSTLWGSSRLSP